MKPFKFIFPIVLFALAVGFWTCQKPDDNTCNDPIHEYPFRFNASRWLFDPIKPGDSIKFKVYHKDKANGGKYAYLRDEGFFIKDTGIQKVQELNTNKDANCNDWMINDYLIADIKGPESLTCKLTNGSYTDLVINLKYREFNGADFQYQSHQFDWDDSLVIGGTKYYDIKLCKGVDSYSKYIDSTYMFYNLKYGMLKFIVNDTLIYMRMP